MFTQEYTSSVETEQLHQKINGLTFDINQQLFRHVNIEKAMDDVHEEDVKNEDSDDQKDSFSQESFSCYDQSIKVYTLKEISEILL